MGLMIHSLEGLSEAHHRDYFIYLLDYGWKEPLSQVLNDNFSKMADMASKQKNAVVIKSAADGVHFSDEVMSWHNINGDDAEANDLLPAILVTNRHPAEFRRRSENYNEQVEDNLKLLIFPLKKYCKDNTEVISLIQKIFHNINLGRDLNDFKIMKDKKKGIGGALAHSIILEPNISGIGFSFNKFVDYFRRSA